jgi:hypothetical protein
MNSEAIVKSYFLKKKSKRFISCFHSSCYQPTKLKIKKTQLVCNINAALRVRDFAELIMTFGIDCYSLPDEHTANENSEIQK